AVGISHGPPNALEVPNPRSSMSTITTFGAPSGGGTGPTGVKAVSWSWTSITVVRGRRVSGRGRMCRPASNSVMRFSDSMPGREKSPVHRGRKQLPEKQSVGADPECRWLRCSQNVSSREAGQQGVSDFREPLLYEGDRKTL